MKSKLEKFLILFTRLKQEVNNTPRNLSRLSQQKPDLQELCFELYDCSYSVRRKLSQQSDKSLVVPSVFFDLWQEYLTGYQKSVAKAATPIKQLRDNEFIKILQQVEKKAKSDGKSTEEFLRDFFEENILVGSTFNPLEDDAAKWVDEIFAIIHDIVLNGDMPEVFEDKHIGAFRYFHDTIGIDLRAINKRWGAAPQLFIPEKALSKNIAPLIELYNEAVCCYIFGLNVSATAMCRALLEHILITHYGIPKKGLKKTIVLAEKQFKKLSEVNMDDLRKAGNRVMHEYERGKHITDDAILNYLLTIRFIVQNVPDK